MSARPAGKRGTPERVMQLLQQEVAKTSQSATARATGLTLRGVQNYLKGIGEPTAATLERLAVYFGVSADYLRGETPYFLGGVELEWVRFKDGAAYVKTSKGEICFDALMLYHAGFDIVVTCLENETEDEALEKLKPIVRGLKKKIESIQKSKNHNSP